MLGALSTSLTGFVPDCHHTQIAFLIEFYPILQDIYWLIYLENERDKKDTVTTGTCKSELSQTNPD